jgi:hypothetical protein
LKTIVAASRGFDTVGKRNQQTESERKTEKSEEDAAKDKLKMN